MTRFTSQKYPSIGEDSKECSTVSARSKVYNHYRICRLEPSLKTLPAQVIRAWAVRFPTSPANARDRLRHANCEATRSG
jgi:hypothetical protein